MPRPETDRHLKAFELWYAASREVIRIVPQVSVSERTIRLWIERFDWHARADARDHEAARRAEQTAIDRKVKLLEEQRQAGQALRHAGVRYLAKTMRDPGATPVVNVRDATLVLKEGFALERQAEGLPDWVGQLVKATDDELDAMESALLRRAAATAGSEDGEGAEGTADLPDEPGDGAELP